ncbi:NVEALA domain-containing protein, partial [Bacteroides acidifaciens]
MRKKIMKAAFVAAFAAVAGYGVYMNQRTEAMSDLMLANVEALASGES